MYKLFKTALMLKKEMFEKEVRYKREWDKGDNYRRLIHKEIPNYLKENFNQDISNIKGSVGSGNYNRVPWIAIYNPQITNKTEDGYYLVYLLHPEGTGLYLSLNQGWTKISNKYKGDAEVAKKRALAVSKYLSKKISQHNFSVGKFKYSNDGMSKYDTENAFPMGYAHGSILYKYYDFSKEISNEEMKQDLESFLDLFDDLASKVSKKDYDKLVNNIDDYLLIEAIEDLKNNTPNQKLEKVDPPKKVTKRAKRKDVVKKKINDKELDNVNKEKKLTGNIGEEIAFKYLEELIENSIEESKREEFQKLLNKEMSKNHGYGYDMVAFDPRNLDEPDEKYIEVKATTSSKKDEPFYFSVNELLAIIKYPKKYLIFRIYDIASEHPKFFIIDPYEHFEEFEDLDDLLNNVFDFEAVQYKIFSANINK